VALLTYRDDPLDPVAASYFEGQQGFRWHDHRQQCGLETHVNEAYRRTHQIEGFEVSGVQVTIYLGTHWIS